MMERKIYNEVVNRLPEIFQSIEELTDVVTSERERTGEWDIRKFQMFPKSIKPWVQSLQDEIRGLLKTQKYFEEEVRNNQLICNDYDFIKYKHSIFTILNEYYYKACRLLESTGVIASTPYKEHAKGYQYSNILGEPPYERRSSSRSAHASVILFFVGSLEIYIEIINASVPILVEQEDVNIEKASGVKAREKLLLLREFGVLEMLVSKLSISASGKLNDKDLSKLVATMIGEDSGTVYKDLMNIHHNTEGSKGRPINQASVDKIEKVLLPFKMHPTNLPILRPKIGK